MTPFYVGWGTEEGRAETGAVPWRVPARFYRTIRTHYEYVRLDVNVQNLSAAMPAAIE